MRLFTERNIDVRGLAQRDGLTMRWHGRYHEDMNKRDTLRLALNVFSDFAPDLLPDQCRADYVFLGNIAPELQSRVLSQVQSPKVVAADTMNHLDRERTAGTDADARARQHPDRQRRRGADAERRAQPGTRRPRDSQDGPDTCW